MPNRLAQAQSLYLRKHADNPIDWWSWCDEALATAQREDKPIFLSIGYSSCHWCTVMEGEAFSNRLPGTELQRVHPSSVSEVRASRSRARRECKAPASRTHSENPGPAKVGCTRCKEPATTEEQLQTQLLQSQNRS